MSEDTQEVAIQLLTDLFEEKIKVTKVEVSGVKRTSDWLLAKNLKFILNSTSFEEFLEKCNEGNGLLSALNIFKSVSSSVHVDEHVENGYKAHFELEEKGWISGGPGVQLGQNEGSLHGDLALNNMTGFGDRLSVASSRSTHGTKYHFLQYSFPLGARFYQPFTFRVSQNDSDLTTCGISQLNRDVLIEQGFLSSFGRHTLAFGSKWMHLSPLTNNPPFSARMESGHFLNNSLTHTLMMRRKLSHTTLGVATLTSQASGLGLGGSFNYIKNVLETSLTYIGLQSLGLQLKFSGRVGAILAGENLPRPIKDRFLPKDATLTTCLPDRFLLGGVYDVRGFKQHSVGPSGDNGLAVGGHTFWAAAAHIYSRLPLGPWVDRFGNMIKLHGWINAGNLTPDAFSPTPQFIQGFISNCNVACGLGVSLDLGRAAVEVNYNIPIKTTQGCAAPGLAFALGVNFL
eukprot:m.241486 g.241486  ORF g.241486 m.241486 type:complete len:457 (+) comp22241_c0_seq1:48-1418(+)